MLTVYYVDCLYHVDFKKKRTIDSLLIDSLHTDSNTVEQCVTRQCCNNIHTHIEYIYVHRQLELFTSYFRNKKVKSKIISLHFGFYTHVGLHMLSLSLHVLRCCKLTFPLQVLDQPPPLIFHRVSLHNPCIPLDDRKSGCPLTDNQHLSHPHSIQIGT